jgi:hypothetical protein
MQNLGCYERSRFRHVDCQSIHIIFTFAKLNNLKVINDLYSQCLTQTLSKTTSKSDTEGVCLKTLSL